MSAYAVNVKQFGAMGDGVTDDTAAFAAAQEQAASRNPNSTLALIPNRGGNVVYVPPGFYIADIQADTRVNWIGEKHQSVIMAATDGGYAFHYFTPPPHQIHRWQRPFVQNIAIQGTTGLTMFDRSRGGIKIENLYGVDLIDVQFYRCTTGIHSAQNYYGTWDRIIAYECNVGIHLTKNGDNSHTGNKRILNPQLRVNNIGLLVDNKAARTVLYGGTIEGNRTGVGFYWDGVESWWDVTALSLRDIWFEDNDNPDRGDELTFPNGSPVKIGDIHVEKGTVLLDNCGAAHVNVSSQAHLYSIYSHVGRGPTDAYLNVEAGGYVGFRHSLVPFPYQEGVNKLWPEV